MARTSAQRLRGELVANLRAKGVIRSDPSGGRVSDLSVPRERFVPTAVAEHGLRAVYRDDAIVTKRDPHGMPLSSSSQPALMAQMLELLAPRAGHRVLEIGAGTGYNAALLAHIVGPTGRVTSVDVDADSVRAARRALRETGYRVSVTDADGREGHPSAGPYDRIIVTACADEIPRAWFHQLKDGGLLVLPLRLDPDGAAIQLIPVLERRGDRLHSVGVTWGGFMPLHGGDGGWRPPSATLGAGRSAKGEHAVLISMSGAGLERLPADAARELLASALTKQDRPRRYGVTDMSPTSPPLFLIYLLLRIPAAKRVSLVQDGRLGVGMVDTRSRSLAVISLRSPWNSDADTRQTRPRWRLDSYGSDDAAVRLEQLISEWQQLQRQRRRRLRLTARAHNGSLRLSFAWARTEHLPGR